EDLVRVGIPDAIEQARIGERALQGVGLAGERRVELLGAGAQHVESAAVVGGEGGRAADHVERGAWVRSRLRGEEGAAWEVERGEAVAPGNGRAVRGGLPVQASGDH